MISQAGLFSQVLKRMSRGEFFATTTLTKLSGAWTGARVFFAIQLTDRIDGKLLSGAGQKRSSASS